MKCTPKVGHNFGGISYNSLFSVLLIDFLKMGIWVYNNYVFFKSYDFI